MLPAYAGMIPVITGRFEACWSAPRVCGDDPAPPLGHHIVDVVLPAYAGMIHDHQTISDAGDGAPRVCGDDPTFIRSASAEVECSPRMRG